MENIILTLIIILILGLAISYIVKAKKKGVRCIGCSCASGCSGNCSSCSPKSNDKYDEIINFEFSQND